MTRQCGYCQHLKYETLHSKIMDIEVNIGYCNNEKCRYHLTERSFMDIACDKMCKIEPVTLGDEIEVTS